MQALSFRILLLACLTSITTTELLSQQSQRPSIPTAEATGDESHNSNLLRQFNGSLQALVAKVSPAVVQIQTAGLAPLEASKKNGVALIVRQRAIGSGVIVDPDGYIMTNAHVVEGAERVRVVLPVPPSRSPLEITPVGKRQVLDAKVVGIHKETDLALLKIDGQHLPTLPLGTRRPVEPGELVFAIGSPEGLQNSVTMGVVSSVWRQPDPGNPMVYLQTDAPINPGNSGGPLVDLDGYVVGLNTFILSEGGGSEGLGFAIPARVVTFVYGNLRKYGHVHRTEIQGRPILGLPGLTAALYLHAPDEAVRMEILRGNEKILLEVPALQSHDKADQLADFIDPNSRIGRLGIYVMEFDDRVRAAMPDVRIPSGVVVLGQSLDVNALTGDLHAGDIIHAVNQARIQSVEQLRSTLRQLKSGDPLVLQIERQGQLQYIDSEME